MKKKAEMTALQDIFDLVKSHMVGSLSSVKEKDPKSPVKKLEKMVSAPLGEEKEDADDMDDLPKAKEKPRGLSISITHLASLDRLKDQKKGLDKPAPKKAKKAKRSKK